MHDRMKLKSFPDEKKESIVVELWQNDKPIGHIVLTSDEIEKHINRLAENRAELKEQVVPDLDPGSRVAAVVDPIWRVPDYRLAQGRPLFLRHPGLGWLSFVFPDKEASAIADWLTRDLPEK